jgi:hypothetical protein
VDSFVDDFSEELDSSSDLFPTRRLSVFVQASRFDESRKRFNFFGKKYGIMEQFLMALIAKHRRFTLAAPRAFFEQRLSFPFAVSGPPKEALCNEMVFGCMRASPDRWLAVIAAPVQNATA